MSAPALQEFNINELPEQQARSLKDYWLVIRRRKVQVAVTSFAIFTLAAVVAFVLPSIYRSTATILIEQQEIPTELVRSTVTSYADQRIQIISRRIMTSANLWRVIEKYNLYPESREKEPREKITDTMRSDISTNMISAEVVDPRSGRPVEATIAFSMAYQSKSPGLAQKVANELTTLLLNENLKTRTESAAETTGFLADEARKLEEQISILEKKLSDFKEQNINSLPELVDLNMSLMDKTERDLVEVDRQIRLLEERKIYLKSQLLQINPNSSVISDTGERILSPAGRLKVAQSEYVQSSASYSPDHPDIKKLEKEIAALEKETGQASDTEIIDKRLIQLKAELVSSREKYSAEHPDVIRLEKEIANLEKMSADASRNKSSEDTQIDADNPAYLQIRADYDAAGKELASFKQRKKELEQKMSDFESRLLNTPRIEREYRELTRNYQNATAKYQETKAKQMEAQLAESMEIERKGEKFTLIEPPQLPETPVKPNRKALIMLGFILAVGGGLGIAFLLDAVDGNIHGRKALIALAGAPPLAVVPYIQTEAELAKKIKLLKLTAVSAVACFIFALLVFHFLIMPLDTFWYVLLRKLGS